MTKRGRVAVNALVDLALRQEKGLVTLGAISRRLEFSLSYLEFIFEKLRKHEIVKAKRGLGGGYELARPTENVSVADIILSVDKPRNTALSSAQRNGNNSDPEDDAGCMTNDLWPALDKKIMDYLASVSLKDLIDRNHAKPTGMRPS
jgi:Rrf2 family transcriptional regulator, iron-sulfur cluster assembly transcription factor